MSFWGELKRRNVYKVGAAYLLFASIVAQAVSIVNEPLHLPEGFDTVILVLLIVGFPLALILAWAYELTAQGLKRTRDVAPNESIAGRTGQRLNYIIAGLLIGAIVGFGTSRFVDRDVDGDWARDVAIPQIEQYAEEGNWEAAYRLALEVEEKVPDNPQMAKLWPEFAFLAFIQSEPPGAQVLRRPYDPAEGKLENFGVTPIAGKWLPFGASVLQLDLEGHERKQIAVGNTGSERSGFTVRLSTAEDLPEDTISVPGFIARIDGEDTPFRGFLLGRHEVTNAEYQRFVNAGGYEDRSYWQHPFTRNGLETSWEEAMADFTDTTGDPGPANWTDGEHDADLADYPVSGISWHEAAAYAAFVGAELPTVYHWRNAYWPSYLHEMLPLANFDNRGPQPVGVSESISWSGAIDMAGNVREWVFNETQDGRRVTLGGSWVDLPSTTAMTTLENSPALDPFDRSDSNGFRIAYLEDPETPRQRAMQPIPERKSYLPDFEPVTDQNFESIRRFYDYVSGPLNARTDESKTLETDLYRRERVSINHPSGNGTMSVYLYLPKGFEPPWQTVLYWPGSGALRLSSVDDYSVQYHLDFLLKSGRAVAFPEFRYTFERGGGTIPGEPVEANLAWNIEWVQEARRTVDLLESRPEDFDLDKLGLFGFSWGALSGARTLALDDRFDIAIMYVGGFPPQDHDPELDLRTFLPRIQEPFLLISGINDPAFPLETTAVPYFDWVGTADDEKSHVKAPGGHGVDRAIVIRESRDWLDRWLGEPDRIIELSLAGE